MWNGLSDAHKEAVAAAASETRARASEEKLAAEATDLEALRGRGMTVVDEASGLDPSPLLAVPMFIMAAALLSATGVTTYMLDLVRMIVGRLRGGMAHVNVLLSLVFAGMSGAALTDIGALGGVQVCETEKQGYTRRFAAGLTLASAGGQARQVGKVGQGIFLWRRGRE